MMAVILLCCCAGCGKQDCKEREDLEFTICPETQLPDELREIIEEKKLHAFQISYTTKDHLYIAVGYGMHDRTNLQVIVQELYKTDRAIYIKTELMTQEESVSDGTPGTPSMYPYIVLKLPRLELPVLSVS